MTKKVRTLFIGTSEFAVPILKKLTELDFIKLVGIVTQPDKPVGRKQTLTPPPVKESAYSLKFKAEVFQPTKLKNNSQTILDETNPELIIVASYGQMIPDDMLNYPKYKCLNIHGSLLPDLRGATPVPIAILKGYEKTGTTIQVMEKELDAGDIVAQREEIIREDDTTESLKLRLSEISCELLEEILPKWFAGEIEAKKQDEGKATFCSQKDIAKENAELLPSDSAVEVDRKVRAFYPWPIAWAKLKSEEANKLTNGIEVNEKFSGKILKIYKTKVLNNSYPHKKDLKLFRFGKRLMMRCDTGWAEVLECQVEGKQKMTGKEALFLAIDKAESARGIVIHDNKVLLIYRKKFGKEYYISPGGAVGVNEKPEDTVIREIKEETNVDVKVKGVAYEYIDKTNGFDYRHICYLCEPSGETDELKILGEETQYAKDENYYEPVWIPLDEATKLPITKELKEYIEENF